MRLACAMTLFPSAKSNEDTGKFMKKYCTMLKAVLWPKQCQTVKIKPVALAIIELKASVSYVVSQSAENSNHKIKSFNKSCSNF